MRSKLFDEALFAPAVPDHQMIRKIGGGSYGQVWLARGVTGSYRAVKIVAREDFRHERTFEREFEGIRKFEPISRTHPGLVDILHVGRSFEESFYYYVMELADDLADEEGDLDAFSYEAHTLRADIRSGERLPTQQCLRVGAGLADALHHLHLRGLAHRDVKPSNVIFVRGVAKLADIGLVAETGQQTFVGTEGFVPPEGPGTPRADIYSLGMVLYEMSTGKDRLDFPELPDTPPPAGEERDRWRQLNDVICKCCMTDPRKRYASAAEVRDALELIARGMKPLPSVAPKLIAIGGLAACLAVFGLLWVLFGDLLRPQPKNASTSPAPRPNEAAPAAPAQSAPLARERKGLGPMVLVEPANAMIHAEGGRELGVAPIDLGRLAKDGVTVIELRAPGFARKRCAVADLRGLEKVGLSRQPDPGQPWTWTSPWGESEMVFRFEAETASHVTRWPVSWPLFQRFIHQQRGDEMAAGDRIDANEYSPVYDGSARQFAVVSPEAAARFCDWLAELDRQRGVIPSDLRYQPELESLVLGPMRGGQVFRLRLARGPA